MVHSPHWTEVPHAEVALLIAESIHAAHASPAPGSARLGSVTLHPHQVKVLGRVRSGLERHGGVLLAESVGRGKTFVALAVARSYERVTVVCPASLVAMWQSSLRLTGLTAEITSAESLSRGTTGVADGRCADEGPTRMRGIIIVDEAHHFRNPRTARFERLRSLCTGSDVLLLTATPIHNREGELRTALSLFLGAAAECRPLAALAEHIIRSAAESTDFPGISAVAPTLPSVVGPRWIEAGFDEHSLDGLLSLPPPVPPADGGDGGVLLTYTMLRQWSSSRAALRGALQRRLLRAEALLNAVEQGKLPTRQELAAWSIGAGAVQLCFADLLMATGRSNCDHATHDSATGLRELRDALISHQSAVRALVADLDHSPDPDEARAEALRGIITAHAGERVVVFTSFAETAATLYRRLAGAFRCCALTGRSARVAGGTLSRREALRRFAPAAQHADPPGDAERIDVLFSTDILSEGCNLQDASVVIHADLPWTPARLEQRVGRVRRLGSAHADVYVYVLRPPATPERILEVEARLRQKLATAMRGVGVSGAILPSLAAVSGDAAPTPPSAAESLSRLIEWAERTRTSAAASPAGKTAGGDPGRARGGAPTCKAGEICVAAVAAELDGWVALVDGGSLAEVIARRGRESPSSDPALVAELLGRADVGGSSGTGVDTSDAAVEDALASISNELSRRHSARLAGLDAARLARARKRLLRRLAVTGGRLPRWKRVELLPLIAAGQRLATQVLPAGAERVLDELAGAQLDEEPWLRAIAAFTEAHSAARNEAERDSGRLIALLLLVQRRDPEPGPHPPASPGRRHDHPDAPLDPEAGCRA